MQITFIGTGSAFNHADGNNSAFLEFDGTNLLLDCGHDVPMHFEAIYGSVTKIENIWISHLHADHIGGLEEIGFKCHFTPGAKKPNLYIHEKLYPELMDYLEATMKYTTTGLIPVDTYFEIIPVLDEDLSSFTIGNEEFYMQPVLHINKQAPAFYLAGDNFVYTGDTRFIDWSKFNLTKVEYIFQDTQLQDYGENVHTTLPELLSLPATARSKIWCMHYGSDIDSFENQIRSAGMNIVKKWKTMKLK